MEISRKILLSPKINLKNFKLYQEECSTNAFSTFIFPQYVKFHIKFIKYANKPFISPQKSETWDFNICEFYQIYPLPSYLTHIILFPPPIEYKHTRKVFILLSIFKSIFNFEPFKRQSGEENTQKQQEKQ